VRRHDRVFGKLYERNASRTGKVVRRSKEDRRPIRMVDGTVGTLTAFVVHKVGVDVERRLDGPVLVYVGHDVLFGVRQRVHGVDCNGRLYRDDGRG